MVPQTPQDEMANIMHKAIAKAHEQPSTSGPPAASAETEEQPEAIISHEETLEPRIPTVFPELTSSARDRCDKAAKLAQEIMDKARQADRNISTSKSSQFYDNGSSARTTEERM